MTQVEELLGGVRDALSVKRVYGDPYEKDGVTFIPAASVGGGGGGGGGGDEDGNSGSGGGFGLGGRPVGAYVIKDGNVRWEPAIDVTRLAVMGQVLGLVALLILRSMVKGRAKRKLKATRRKKK